MCMGSMQSPKEPPKAGSPGTERGSLANPSGFDFSRMSDYEFEQARNVPAIQLNSFTVEAQERRAEAIQKEIERRDAPRRLAEERRALIAQHQVEMADVQRQYAEGAEQARKAQESLLAQTTEERQRLLEASNTERSRIQAETKQKVQEIGAASGAVSSSLRALATRGNQSQGPTAQTTGRKQQAAGARATTASLRMGATGRGSGAGANLSV